MFILSFATAIELAEEAVTVQGGVRLPSSADLVFIGVMGYMQLETALLGATRGKLLNSKSVPGSR